MGGDVRPQLLSSSDQEGFLALDPDPEPFPAEPSQNSVVVELAYVQKGSRNSIGTLTRLNYAEAPLLMEAKFSLGDFTVFVPFGFAVG